MMFLQDLSNKSYICQDLTSDCGAWKYFKIPSLFSGYVGSMIFELLMFLVLTINGGKLKPTYVIEFSV